MYKLPKNIEEAIKEFQKLPSIGAKTAERLVFFLLRKPESFSEHFGGTMSKLKKNWSLCQECFSFSEHEKCSICADDTRESSTICIVEETTDLIALEKTGGFKGKYHVLGGVVSPLKGIGPDHIRVRELVNRIETNKEISEIILATNPNIEGETTAMYIVKTLKDFPNLKVTRLARGLPSGGDLEYADEETISRALSNRTNF